MNPSPDRHSFAAKLQTRLAASRFFTFSLLLHVIIVLLASGVVLFQACNDPRDFPSITVPLTSGEEAVRQPSDDDGLEPSTRDFQPDRLEINAPIFEAVVTNSMLAQDFRIARVVLPFIGPATVNLSMVIAANPPGGAIKGIPSIYQGRMSGTARAMARKMNGGREGAERAVMAGLRWLKEHQNSDGSWSDEHRPSMTGLALLCFLGHGETPESPEFGPSVKQGLDWLLLKGPGFDGRMSMTRDGWGSGSAGVYEHAIATYAMAEHYTMTKDDRFVEMLKQAVGRIVAGQAPDGGWQYGYAKAPDSDTSVSGWQIQALKAAHLTGLEITGVDEALDKAMLNLKRVQAGDGSFGYRKAGDRDYSLDGVGVLCTCFWKQDKDRTVRDGLEHMLRQTDKKYPVKYKSDTADLYAWYYNTQACLMMGGRAWNKWNHWFQDEIVRAQSPGGSWPVTAGKSPGGELQGKPGGAGPCYRTTLCVLMLEVFYRYMPVTKG